MPIYEFLCETCGLKFEKLFSRQSNEQECPCSSCGAEANRVHSVFSHSFAGTPKGIGPQNTGVHGIDYNYDQVIGRDAEVKWKQIEQRNSEKDKVIAQERKAGLDVKRDQLVRTSEGEYRTITEPERLKTNENRQIVSAVKKAAEQQKKKQGE